MNTGVDSGAHLNKFVLDGGAVRTAHEDRQLQRRIRIHLQERIFIELMTLDCELKASRKGSK